MSYQDNRVPAGITGGGDQVEIDLSQREKDADPYAAAGASPNVQEM